MEWLFIAAWCVAVAAHIYASRYLLPMWASGFKRKPRHEGYGRKALVGDGIFVGAIAASRNWQAAGTDFYATFIPRFQFMSSRPRIEISLGGGIDRVRSAGGATILET
jgi:hypothetical protein